jgi:TusA-related sulfurtransferase
MSQVPRLIFGVSVALKLSAAWADANHPQCTSEASLLQKQQQRSKQLKPGNKEIRYFYEAVPDQFLEKMIVSDPWVCDLLPTYDPRRPTCGMSFADSGLHPGHMSELGNSSFNHKDTIRMLFPIGAMPCCSTPPFCSAPECADKKSISLEEVESSTAGGKSCTKRDPKENFEYMKNSAAWPVYHGWGGAFEMDVHKHWDVLGRLLRKEGNPFSFDLVVDIGANSGYVTEKLTTRRFANNYILVEAYKGMKDLFDTRFGDEGWRRRWFSEQVPSEESEIPRFEFLNFAVNDHTEGTLDLCYNEQWSGMNNNVPCPVDKVAIDDAIPGRLSSEFKSMFAAAKSAYVKIDVEGMDEMTLRGMRNLLREERGQFSNGDTKHLVNFMMFEFCPVWMDNVKMRDQLSGDYDLKTMTSFLEDMGFETFLVGPRYLPLSHGSWDDSFRDFAKDVENSVGGTNYPAFLEMHCPGPECPTRENLSNVMSADIFAIRSTHPMANKIKQALGVCKESHDFEVDDPQYKPI